MNANTLKWINRALLGAALVAAALVYGQCLDAGWFYDDADYVLGDPRINHLELFWPWHWSDQPPALDKTEEIERVIPGYEKPLIADRYLWHLSFALERSFFGDSPRAAHAVNLLIHGLCIALLFLALKRLLYFYESEKLEGAEGEFLWGWRLLPGLAALAYAIHPWASEPVCYISARNGSMAAVCVLLGLISWLYLLDRNAKIAVRISGAFGALFFAAAAYACKENAGIAPAGYLLATWPVLWNRVSSHSRGRIIGIVAGAAVFLLAAGWLIIHGSDRAAGLFAQVSVRGWTYFFEIQNPLLLLTLLDQIPCSRLSLETNHPGWSQAACAAALLANLALVAAGTFGARKRPLLLGIGWFYLFLLPTNSFLPRPDFLAMRNMPLPVMGIATLAAGALIWTLHRFARWTAPAGVLLRVCTVIAFSVFTLHWAGAAHWWAEGFLRTPELWMRSAQMAPDHATVRLNLATEYLMRGVGDNATEQGEMELRAALAAENSPTMFYHSDRSRMMRRMYGMFLLGKLARAAGYHRDAEAYFARSWQEYPRLETWVFWIESCAEGHLNEELELAQKEGARVWPNGWWPRVVSAFQRAQKQSDGVSPDVLADLTSAEDAPDATHNELRMLQIRVISTLVTLQDKSPKNAARLVRLRNLGAADEVLKAVEAHIHAE
jgi:hypothetical protein